MLEKGYLNEKEVLEYKKCYKGFIKEEKQLAKIYNSSKINLNITLRSIKSGIPLRCMEIMSCGGFLLTNFQSDFLKHFVAGEDFVYFESNDDMLQKIEYYLTHEKERTSIAESGYQKVIKNHSYETIFQQIFNIIG
jgi:spore maturation protein CgeB